MVLSLFEGLRNWRSANDTVLVDGIFYHYLSSKCTTTQIWISICYETQSISYIIYQLLLEQHQDFFLLLGPAMECDFMSFEAQPFEHARFGLCSWDERRDEGPALMNVMNFCYWNWVFLTMFADKPDEYFQVTDAPIPFELSRLGHSIWYNAYFSILFSVSWSTI